MNIAVLLMAGLSQRFNSQTPKQFIEINNKKVYQYCLDTFYKNKDIDKIILVTTNDSINDLESELSKEGFDLKRINIISGGKTRTESLKHALDFINLNKWTSNIITHDVARALISNDIINKHISEINNNNNIIVNTYIESTDTLSTTVNGKQTILDRSQIIRHQTPQTISVNNLNNVFDKLSQDQWSTKTDLCDLCSSLNLKVVNILGDNKNFKITTLSDLDLFKYYINNKKI